jgi:histidine ammonia-lyase
LPTEQYNQDVVTLGMHSAVTAAEALGCLRDEIAMVLLAAAQAVDLRGGPERLGHGSRRVYSAVRHVAAFMERDRPMEGEVAAVAAEIQSGKLEDAR